MSSGTVRIGSQIIDMADAREWVSAYFDLAANRTAKKPYAYPAYDQLDTGSGPNSLNDGASSSSAVIALAETIVARPGCAV